MYKISSFIIGICFVAAAVHGQKMDQFDVTEQWSNKVREAAPVKPEVAPKKPRKVLVFGLHTGFYHWAIPHVNEVMTILGEKSGAFEVDVRTNVSQFKKELLSQYDAVVLNNTCSVGPRRDLILDALERDSTLFEDEQVSLAAELEKNLIEFVEEGGGLMVVHGGIVMQNNSEAFSEMVGGSFDYHPPQQEVQLELSDPDHPLVQAFDGAPFTHIDEPYMFKNAYEKKNFRPLLYFDATKITKKRKEVDGNVGYVSWIKRHGEGRVFYVSPSHNAQSLEDPRMLKFYLDGAQYVLGDLACDDSPMELSVDYK